MLLDSDTLATRDNSWVYQQELRQLLGKGTVKK